MIDKSQKSGVHRQWPYYLIFATPVIIGLLQPFHLPFYIVPLVAMLIWVPFDVADAIRTKRMLAEEKAVLQAKFDAEDQALLGCKVEPLI